MYSRELKLQRANEHLKSVDDEVGRLLDVCQKGVWSDAHLDGQVMVAVIRAPQETVSERLSAYVGDCVQNLRAALDHIVAYLTVMNGGSFRTSQFPIFADEKSFADRGADMIAGLSAEQQAVVKGLQPYNCRELGEVPTDAPLWLLRELSNWDKHNALAVSWTAIEVGEIRITDSDDIKHLSTEIRERQGPLVPNAELFTLRFRVTKPHGTVEVQPDLTINVSFTNSPDYPAGGRLVVDTLADVAKTIGDEVFPAFEPIPSPFRAYMSPPEENQHFKD